MKGSLLGIGIIVLGLTCLLLATQDREASLPHDDLTSITRHLGLPPDSVVTIDDQAGPWYRLHADPPEGGGGMWIVVYHTVNATNVITQGQDYPECVPIEGAGVPKELIRYCWTAPRGGYVKDRVSGLEATNMEGY